MEKRVLDMRVKSITKIEKQKKKGETIVYKLVAKDNEGLNELRISSAYPFKGLNAETGVVQLILKNSQKSLEDFGE